MDAILDGVKRAVQRAVEGLNIRHSARGNSRRTEFHLEPPIAVGNCLSVRKPKPVAIAGLEGSNAAGSLLLRTSRHRWCRTGKVSTEFAGRNLLFSEDRQAIYQHDDVTAHVWRSIERGLDTVQIVEDLVAQGIGIEHASCTVNDVLRSGVELGVIQTAPNSVTKEACSSDLQSREWG